MLDSNTDDYNRLKDIIACEIEDDSDFYKNQIERAIFQAIDFYKYENFQFNYTRDYEISLKENRPIYSQEEVPILGKVSSIKDTILKDKQQSYPLSELNYKEIENFFHNFSKHTSRPTYWSFSNHLLKIFPIPDKSYNVSLTVSPCINFNETKNNPWLEEGFFLIKARAKYTLFRDILKYHEASQNALIEVSEHYNRLKVRTSSQANFQYIKYMEF